MLKRLTLAIITVLTAATASAQAMFINSARVTESDSLDSAIEADANNTPIVTSLLDDSISLVADSVVAADSIDEPFTSIYAGVDSIEYDTVMVMKPLPAVFFSPTVYNTFEFADTISPFTREISGKPEMYWIEVENSLNRKMKNHRRTLTFDHPEYVRYNVAMLPVAPKVYHAVVNPEDHTITIKETNLEKPVAATYSTAPVKRRHWIRKFTASLQFSQAYVSPNWYQGGNNNLNMLGNIYYNVKLNQEFHPNLLFETTAQYKIGMNSTPEDTVRNYNISDDLFQINTTLGIKAANRWYYSFTGQFKTQIFNSYGTNSRKIRSAFLSPGELTIGIGMTYNYANPKKTFTFDASIAPLSYSMKTCIHDEINPKNYNVEEGHKVKHNYGSSGEVRLSWKLAYNISFTSRLFAFTDYDYGYADWENKLQFDINRFLTTQIYAHLRYDSSTPKCDDPDWKKLQVKEILSIGFSYKFSSI